MRTPMEFDLDKVRVLAARGLTQKNIAKVLGVTEKTITNHKKYDAAFKDAIENGNAMDEARLAGYLDKLCEAGNLSAIIFKLKCKHGWRETQQIDVNSNVKVSEKTAKEVVSELTNEELLEIARMKLDETEDNAGN